MEKFASADYTHGQTNAIIKKLIAQGGPDGPMRFLRGEISVSEPIRSWREEDSVIYFSVTSDGTAGEEWIKRLEGKGFRVGDYAKSVLLSKDFKPTTGVTTEVAVLKGMLFEDKDRITKKIRTKAANHKLETLNAEVACLIREKFTDKEIEAMGLTWIVAMHEPIKDSGGVPNLLRAYRFGDGSWLITSFDEPGSRWGRGGGFAFAVSQLSSFLSLYFAREFCFVSCPFQPPSILPASSIFTDKAIYFLSSTDFVSQRIRRNNRNVSAFLIASLT